MSRGITWTPSRLDCPRCRGTLREIDSSKKWGIFFECSECWMRFEIFLERRMERCGHDPSRKFLRRHITLQPGRSTRG
jgi:protein-arginine kinase activator protein McsA